MDNTIADFSQFVFELYDIDSSIEVKASADHIEIIGSWKRPIVLWVQDGEIFPEVTHNFENGAIELQTLIQILDVVNNYTGMI